LSGDTPSFTELFSLEGAVAVVTGACGRLGPVWIEALAGAGAQVVGLDLPNASRERLSLLLDRLGAGRIALGVGDVASRASLEGALHWCVETFGPPSILVNNAGIDQPPNAGGPTHSIETMPLELWRSVLEVNLLGAFQAAQVFAGPMLAAGRGAIVNIGSLYASVSPDQRFYDHIPQHPPFLKPPAYGASKAALVNLTKYLATLWAPRGVRVNALSPGGVLGGQDAEFQRKYTSRVPLGRMAEPADLSGPLLFLVSDAARYVTGIDLRVDGGFTAW
jgi:NAD(P)-dependent dehydrogenase (short-subunit alcohol dehydrogenase family)